MNSPLTILAQKFGSSRGETLEKQPNFFKFDS